MAKLAFPNARMTFKRAKIGDNQIAGGVFIKWLRGSAPKTFTKARALADLTYQHSRDWITPSVALRNTLAHYADIPGMKHMRLAFRTSPPVFDVREIEEPTMPDSSSVVSFCAGLIERLQTYVAESLLLLPNVKLEMISPNEFLLLKQARGQTRP